MTVDRYLELKNEVKLYRKLHQDYDKRLEVLDKEKTEDEKKMNDSRKKLDDKED
jgi:hypothetical protein